METLVNDIRVQIETLLTSDEISSNYLKQILSDANTLGQQVDEVKGFIFDAIEYLDNEDTKKANDALEYARTATFAD